MRIAVGQLKKPQEEVLKFAKQLGIESIQFNTPDLPGEEKWKYKDLLKLRKKCENFGLKLEAIENVPLKFYDKIMLGLPGRNKQIENLKATIYNMGKAGIPIFGYHFEPAFVWRTSDSTQGRGNAKVTSFNLDKAKEGLNTIDRGRTDVNIETEEGMWDNYKYFIRKIIPAAENAGVKLALHPSDPPVKSLGGIAKLFYKLENFKKAMKLADSEAWGLDLCLGCCSEMPGGEEDVIKMIEYFGSKNKILYTHFRDVSGTVPKFRETFLGEGNFNPAKIINKLNEVDFDGFLISDHVPKIINDTKWGHRARAHAIGYIQGLIKMLDFNKKK